MFATGGCHTDGGNPGVGYPHPSQRTWLCGPDVPRSALGRVTIALLLRAGAPQEEERENQHDDCADGPNRNVRPDPGPGSGRERSSAAGRGETRRAPRSLGTGLPTRSLRGVYGSRSFLPVVGCPTLTRKLSQIPSCSEASISSLSLANGVPRSSITLTRLASLRLGNILAFSGLAKISGAVFA